MTSNPQTPESEPAPEQSLAQDSEAVTPADLEALAAQLGRVPRGVVAIAVRCVCGRPTVVRTAPRLDDGTPFPTSYYLTHPAAVKGCSTLEAEHLMETFNADLAADEELAAAYAAAHADYLARRAELGLVPEIEGVSAGGMPTRVKCLHALLGHALAAGPGVNPIGDCTLEVLRERGLWDPERCFC
ncbi:DUF501 domain-containing protein [Actinomyces viscosus]|uniref:Protein of uncharacterized function (DUF501) n=1 Tax=Actinomyces viscosus TaxID=1656 RepID=A0A448PP38_ACTVI|nr:DUF501 domain-containing protein [Actinomyces viscosus]VEI18328.1 Protein of uncharacterised function (DUF501) [Actinomyces viscosus]